MSHIIVLSSIYLGNASTNGLCAHNIVDALSKMGHDVDVICYEGQSDAKPDNAYTISKASPSSARFFSNVGSIVRKFWNYVKSGPGLFLLQDRVNQYYNTLLKIRKNKEIDAIVAMFFPLETLEALCRYKADHPNVCAIVFELDSIADGVANRYLFQKLMVRKYHKWLTASYKIIDDIIVMKTHSPFWQKKYGDRFRDKVHVSDIPALLPKKCSLTSDSNISFIYAGLIDKEYRSPEYLLAVLRKLSFYMKFCFYFYSKGDCEEMIERTSRVIHCIEQKGYVSQRELDIAICKASFLVSIGNSLSNSVPSKIISYFSYNKPIIHFSSQANDVCISYLKKYPLSLVINQNNSVDESIQQIMSFISRIQQSKNGRIDTEAIFEMNTPSFSAIIIHDIIDSKKLNGRY